MRKNKQQKTFYGRKIPSKKQLFEYQVKYKPLVFDSYFKITYPSDLELSDLLNFYNEIDQITKMSWIELDEIEHNPSIFVSFFQEYYDVINWDLMSISVFEFFLEKFRENPKPMKFKRKLKGITMIYEFGSSIIKRLLVPIVNILFIFPNYWTYYLIRKKNKD